MPDISALQYLKAHGHSPGPTQRPLLTGALSGLAAALPSATIEYLTGAIAGEAQTLKLGITVTLAVSFVISIISGMLYAIVFQRTANDMRGGWLFGSSYGFLLWMLVPVGAWRLIEGRPLVTGKASMGLFAAYVGYGLVLGVVYPCVNRLLQKKFRAL